MAKLPILKTRKNTADEVPPTARELAQYGHFAALLRKYLNDNNLTAPQFMQQIGAPDGAAQIYKWIGAKGAPGAKYRTAVAKLLGVSENDVKKRSLQAPNLPAKMEIVDEPVRLSTQQRSHTRDVLLFSVGDDGQTRIKFDVTVPYASGVPLLRVLLDAGFLVSQSVEAEEE